MPLTTLEMSEVRADGFSREDKTRFVALFSRLHGDLNRVLEVVGIHRATYYKHLQADPAFAEEVRLLKLSVAWSLVPPLYQRAVEKSDTAAIWLQKVLGGPEFNPERSTVSINTHAPTLISFQVPDVPPPSLPIPVNSDESPSEK